MHSSELNFLLEYFIKREGKGVMEYIHEVDLFDSGLLDSLDIIELASLIEKHKGIHLDLTDEITFSSLRRFDSIVEILRTV
jgi:acyl carrier protein